MESFGLCFFPAKGSDDPYPQKTFPGGGGDAVQLTLHFFVAGIAQKHDPAHDQREHQNDRYKNQRQRAVDGKGHDHGAQHNEGTAQEQA